MAYETLLYEVAGGVATITLNRPDKINSFNDQMHKEFIEALKAAEKDAAVRCVVITGAGRGFCAGQDLSSINGKMPIMEIVRRYYNTWVAKIRTMEKPVIAAVNGVAAGAGVGLVLACDLIIFSEKASLTVAFSKVGLVPDTGVSFFLPRLVGYHKAMELALLGDKFTAQQAVEMGIGNKVVAEGEFTQAVNEWAARLAKGPRSLGLTKRQINKGVELGLLEMLEVEAYQQETAGATADAKEAIAAFLEKREPNFTGR